MTARRLTVVIPTYNRPDSLYRAVESLFWQGAAKAGFRVLVADNSADASARMTFDTLKACAPQTLDLAYLHVPEAGVANARNAAVDMVETPLIAFLDDDQSAPTHWLEELLDAFDTFRAAVTFGPVQTVLPDDIQRHRSYFEAFFAREPHLRSGYIAKPFGCGNCLIDTRQVTMKKPWFDVRMNDSGGEDDILFERIRSTGGKFAWAEKAPVYEHPLRQRLALTYTLRRAFAYGQGPCTLARKKQPARYDLLIMWMMIGAGKLGLHGLIWAGMRVTGHPGRAFELDKAVRGLGKILFWKRLRFYGTATVSQPHAASSAASNDAEPVHDTRLSVGGAKGWAQR